MAIIPEHNIDFSMLDLNTDGGYSYQPQVFSVLCMPETVIDSDMLSGKGFSDLPRLSSDKKVELPSIERAPVATTEAKTIVPVIDEEFDADPAFALFTDCPATISEAYNEFDAINLFTGITSEKAVSRIELVVADSAAEEAEAAVAMAKVMRLCESLDTVTARLESLTIGL